MSDKPAPNPQKPSIWPLVAMMMLTLWMCNRPADPKLNLEQCGKHLHTVGVDLEKFRLTSDDKLYPATLEEVYVNKTIPVCPVGGKNSYKEGYKADSSRASYLLVCKGEYHKDAGVPSDFPRIAFGPAEHGSSHTESHPASSPTPQATATPQTAASPQATASPKISVTPKATASPKASPSQKSSPKQGEPKKASPTPSAKTSTPHP